MTAIAEKKANIWQRDELDWYVEDQRVTRQLLSVERFNGPIWDPACGQGNIVAACESAGLSVYGTDIVRRDFVNDAVAIRFAGQFDFLSSRPGQPDFGPYLPFPEYYATNIITNPPFFRAKGAEAFIRKALELARGKVCAFVDIRFVAGDGRANGLFADHPPHRIWVITPRCSCPPGDYLAAGNKAGNGSSDWCWLVWDKTAPFTHTEFGWLRRLQEGEGA